VGTSLPWRKSKGSKTTRGRGKEDLTASGKKRNVEALQNRALTRNWRNPSDSGRERGKFRRDQCVREAEARGSGPAKRRRRCKQGDLHSSRASEGKKRSGSTSGEKELGRNQTQRTASAKPSRPADKASVARQRKRREMENSRSQTLIIPIGRERSECGEFCPLK